jgi:hypothetical protein
VLVSALLIAINFTLADESSWSSLGANHSK